VTLAGDALVRFSDALYLIFKLAVALWQSFDHDIRSVRRVQGTYKEQTLTDLKFVLGHNVVALHKKDVASARFYRKHTRQATAGRASKASRMARSLHSSR
jgi:hypothetical protein